MPVLFKNWFGLNTVSDEELAELNFLDLISYICLVMTVGILGRFSLIQGEKWGKRLGSIWFSLDKKNRSVALENLEIAYGKKLNTQQQTDLAKKVFENTARMIFEYAWYYSTDLEEAFKSFQIKGIDHLHRAHAKGKGVIALTGHLGNWELALAFGPLTGLPVSVVYRKIKNKGVDLFIKNNRKRFDCKVYPLHNARDKIINALASGHLVGLLCDQNCSISRGVFVDFFNKKACTHAGIAKLIRDTRSPVVPVFIYREKTGFTIEVQPELQLEFTSESADDILAITQQCQTVIENIVKRYPDQWFWVHKRWKRRPKDEIQGLLYKKSV